MRDIYEYVGIFRGVMTHDEADEIVKDIQGHEWDEHKWGASVGGHGSAVEYEEGISYNNEILVTLHRRENHHLIADYFNEINDLAISNPQFIFTIPLHPNPSVQKHKGLLSHVNVISPMPYHKMIDTISRCRFIISDSGGIQEEASYLKKKVIVCRKVTERQETIGITSFLCKSPDQLKNNFEKIKSDYIPNSYNCPYGDGDSSKKIVDILIDIL